MDAVVAVTIMESSMMGAALLGPLSPLHSSFPRDPELEYRRQESLVLERLGLQDLRPHGGNGGATTSANVPAGGALSSVARPAPATSPEQPGLAGHALLSQQTQCSQWRPR